MNRVTRREALAQAARRSLAARVALAGAGAAWIEGCGSGEVARPASSGSTLRSTWRDRAGDGQLRVAAGEPLRARIELGPAAATERVLATLGHVTDAHVMDAASPARVPFLDRLGAPFQSTFRPQETLTARVLAGAVRALDALGPDAVIQGGDLIDNDQANELADALAILTGGVAQPGSGPDGYFGVQSAADPDPFYYRPDLDAPRHPGLLHAATRRFASPGLRAPWYPALGDHDVLVQGELVPTALTRSLALGTRALWDLPQGLRLPPGTKVSAGGSPDGPVLPRLVGELLKRVLAGPTVTVPADRGRRQLTVAEVVAALSGGSQLTRGAAGARSGDGARPQVSTRPSRSRLDYALDVGAELRVLVLDLARRGGGSGGLVVPGQAAWLSEQLAAAGERWVLVVSHQPLISSTGGAQLLAVMDRSPRVIAALAGHIHRNSIVARRTSAGGYWLITTASLIDYPQQARALQLVATRGGGVALRCWMLDHVDAEPGASLGSLSRELAYLDAQGGRPMGFSGSWADRNVTLYRRA